MLASSASGGDWLHDVALEEPLRNPPEEKVPQASGTRPSAFTTSGGVGARCCLYFKGK